MTAEPLARTAPLAAWGDALGALPDGVQITPLPFVAMADLRVDPAGPAAAAVAEHLGVALPTTPSTYAESETATAIWLGPDEWLITSPFRTPEELETGLREAVGDGGGAARSSTSPRSAPRCGCAASTSATCSPAAARSTCTPGCSAATPRRRRCSARPGVVLMALDDTGTHYEILVRSSFAGYLASWLLDAATEYRTGG